MSGVEISKGLTDVPAVNYVIIGGDAQVSVCVEAHARIVERSRNIATGARLCQ
jgi:hypothetical protein